MEIEKRLIEVKPGSFIFEFNNSLSEDICKDIVKRFEESKDEHYEGLWKTPFHSSRCLFNFSIPDPRMLA